MIPKEKAQVITAKFACLRLGEDFNKWGINICISEVDKQCALIIVEEILKTNTLQDRNCGFVTLCEKHKEYWLEVKQEINNI